jgi:polar amino acid transport system substrate-binding protein
MAQTNQNVLIYTIMRTPSREKLFKWVRPIGTSESTSLYKLKGKGNISSLTLEEAKRYSIGTNNESMDHIWLKNNGFPTLYYPSKVEQVIRMFFSERFDFIAFSSATLDDEFLSAGFDSRSAISVLKLFETTPHMAVSLSTSDEVLEKLQQSYDALLRENLIVID